MIARLIPPLFNRHDFRFAIFGEKVIESLSHEELEGGVPLNGQLLQLVPYLFWEVPRNRLGACPSRLRVRLFFGGLLNGQLWGGELASAAAGISQYVCEIGSSVHYRRSEKLNCLKVYSILVDLQNFCCCLARGLILKDGLSKGRRIAKSSTLSECMWADREAKPFDSFRGLFVAGTAEWHGIEHHKREWSSRQRNKLPGVGDRLKVVNLRPAGMTTRFAALAAARVACSDRGGVSMMAKSTLASSAFCKAL
jgi:hypothetical protein